MSKPIRQLGAIQTNVVDPTNTPNVPTQYQTGTYYDPTMMVQQPPTNPLVRAMDAGADYQTQPIQTMGAYPTQQKQN